jgi:ferric-dicitrate binding protein FerR (iron transport regulator)
LDRKTLRAVIQEIQPYVKDEIIIVDDEIGLILTGGVFEVGEERPFFDALAAALKIKIIHKKGVIILMKDKRLDSRNINKI